MAQYHYHSARRYMRRFVIDALSKPQLFAGLAVSGTGGTVAYFAFATRDENDYLDDSHQHQHHAESRMRRQHAQSTWEKFGYYPSRRMLFASTTKGVISTTYCDAHKEQEPKMTTKERINPRRISSKSQLQMFQESVEEYEELEQKQLLLEDTNDLLDDEHHENDSTNDTSTSTEQQEAENRQQASGRRSFVSNLIKMATRDINDQKEQTGTAAISSSSSLDAPTPCCGRGGGGGAYPNFSRHGSSALLPQYLTPDMYERLKDKRTSNGVGLEDIIQAGVALPYGANPPRGLAGIYVGDAECYDVFAPLLKPLILDHLHYRRHHQPRDSLITRRTTIVPETNNSTKESIVPTKPTPRPTRRRPLGVGGGGFLKRHESNLNYKQLVSQVVDPKGEYILYTRMRLARSIKGFRFAPCMDRNERRKVESLVKDCVNDLADNNNTDTFGPKGKGGEYVSIMEMSNEQHQDYIQRRILFNDPDDFAIIAGLGRDWPDGRGLYADTFGMVDGGGQGDMDDMPSIIIWCNVEDHLWIISNHKGGDVQGVFTKLSQTMMALEESLKKRGYRFIEDPKLGFLNTSPAHVGTALRASVYVKLVRLSRQPGFFDLIRRLKLEATSDYNTDDQRFTGIYDIANAEALGKSEVDLINIMIRGVGVLIDLEKQLEKGENIDLRTYQV